MAKSCRFSVVAGSFYYCSLIKHCYLLKRSLKKKYEEFQGIRVLFFVCNKLKQSSYAKKKLTKKRITNLTPSYRQKLCLRIKQKT